MRGGHSQVALRHPRGPCSWPAGAQRIGTSELLDLCKSIRHLVKIQVQGLSPSGTQLMMADVKFARRGAWCGIAGGWRIVCRRTELR